MKWTVFDLEFTELMPAFDQSWPIKDLHISCASVISTDEECPQVWHEIEGEFMSSRTIQAFIDLLVTRAESGYTLVTWGGSASDWRVLAMECPEKRDVIKQLALDSIDLPMCSCVSIGMMMGLNSACMALGFNLKDSESSKSVPEMWKNNERNAVLQHVSNDSFATMHVLVNSVKNNCLQWITQRGNKKYWTLHLRTVRECLQCELPKVPFVIAPHMNAKLLARWLIIE